MSRKIGIQGFPPLLPAVIPGYPSGFQSCWNPSLSWEHSPGWDSSGIPGKAVPTPAPVDWNPWGWVGGDPWAWEGRRIPPGNFPACMAGSVLLVVLPPCCPRVPSSCPVPCAELRLHPCPSSRSRSRLIFPCPFLPSAEFPRLRPHPGRAAPDPDAPGMPGAAFPLSQRLLDAIPRDLLCSRVGRRRGMLGSPRPAPVFPGTPGAGLFRRLFPAMGGLIPSDPAVDSFPHSWCHGNLGYLGDTSRDLSLVLALGALGSSYGSFQGLSQGLS